MAKTQNKKVLPLIKPPIELDKKFFLPFKGQKAKLEWQFEKLEKIDDEVAFHLKNSQSFIQINNNSVLFKDFVLNHLIPASLVNHCRVESIDATQIKIQAKLQTIKMIIKSSIQWFDAWEVHKLGVFICSYENIKPSLNRDVWAKRESIAKEVKQCDKLPNEVAQNLSPKTTPIPSIKNSSTTVINESQKEQFLRGGCFGLFTKCNLRKVRAMNNHYNTEKGAEELAKLLVANCLHN